MTSMNYVSSYFIYTTLNDKKQNKKGLVSIRARIHIFKTESKHRVHVINMEKEASR